jgi:hypothetical protein
LLPFLGRWASLLPDSRRKGRKDRNSSHELPAQRYVDILVAQCGYLKYESMTHTLADIIGCIVYSTPEFRSSELK